MATDTDTEPSRTPASYWARPNSHRSTPASILRADLTANLTDLPAEDATVLLGPRFWKLPTELFDEVVSQLPSSVDVMAAVSSLWRVAVWRALAAWFRTYEQLRAAAGVVRARFPCLHKGNAKQLRWPVEFDDVAPAVLSHQPWLKSVSWDDFKTTQAAIAASLAQDTPPSDGCLSTRRQSVARVAKMSRMSPRCRQDVAVGSRSIAPPSRVGRAAVAVCRAAVAVCRAAVAAGRHVARCRGVLRDVEGGSPPVTPPSRSVAPPSRAGRGLSRRRRGLSRRRRGLSRRRRGRVAARRAAVAVYRGVSWVSRAI
eukprot:scaffold10817_cov54-Phaeocystis_antarctica.AAC.1